VGAEWGSSELAIAQLLLGGERQIAETLEVGQIGAPQTCRLESRAVEVRELLEVDQLPAQLVQIDELRAQFLDVGSGVVRWTQTTDWAIV
jgi:hypothetical protein